MATTPDTYARFIGRVGALAVALGIGAALANSPGIALAQDGQSGGTGAAGSSSNTTSTTGSSTADSAPSQGSEDSGANDTGDADDGSPTAGDDGPATDDAEGVDGEGADEDVPTDGSDGEVSGDDAAQAGSDNAEQAATSTTPTASTDGDDTDLETTDPADIGDIGDDTDAQDQSSDSTFGTTATPTEEASPLQASRTFASFSEPSTPTAATTGIGGFVTTVLSALGFGPQAANSDPLAPPQAPMLWTMLGWARREIGNLVAPFAVAAGMPVAALTVDTALAAEDSPLATDEQLAAERIATQTAKSLPVALMKIVLRQQFLSAAHKQYPQGLDEGSLAALDKAVNEYAMAASFQQLLLNSMMPSVVTQVAPPHIWFGQNVPGSRILYDNPDTIYRFMGVNGASEYKIHGQFLNYGDPDAMPADTTFSVLEGLAGTTSSILTAGDLQIDEGGRFTITVSRAPAAEGERNHPQLTSGSTIIAARNTLADWNDEVPMTLSIERTGGPPNSLFAQIGGFAFLGSQVSDNPLLTTLVSLVPPLPVMPSIVRGAFTAVILIVRGASQESKYMELATTDPDTGEPRPANEVSQPSSNAEFLANQLQSNGHFQLEDGQALVLKIDPGRANYFVVPTYDIWTITDDYWNKQTSLNNEQALDNGDGTYTVVISPTDPGVTNWIDTGGLHQGTISIRFQDLEPDPNNLNPPRILEQHVIDVDDAASYFPDEPQYVVDSQQRQDQLDERKAGFDNRWAPYPQP